MHTLTQISSHTHLPLPVLSTHSVSLPVGRQKHTLTLRESASRAASRAASQPEGCDIAVKGPEEVDNSTASGMLGPEWRNEIRILPAARRLRDRLLTAEETD